MWLATIDGLNRFDGKSFKKFKSNVSDHAKVGSVFTRVENLDPHTLLLGSPNGLICFDLKRLVFKSFNEVFERLPFDNTGTVHDLYIASNGKIYLSQNNFFYVIDTNQDLVIKEELKSPIWHFTDDKQGNVYGHSNHEIFLLSRSKMVHQVIHWGDIRQREIKDVTFSELGNFMAIKETAILAFDLKNDTLFVRSTEIPLKASFSSLQVTRKESLWIGTRDKGVFKYDIKSKQLLSSLKGLNNRLASQFILCIYESVRGTTHIGTSGGGFGIHLNESQYIKHVRPGNNMDNSSVDNMVFGLSYAEDGSILFGGLNSGLKMYNPTSSEMHHYQTDHLPKEAMNMYDFECLNDEVYIASWYGLLKLDHEKQLVDLESNKENIDRLYCLLKLNENELLLGGESGLFIYNLKSQAYKQAPKQDSNLQMSDLIIRFMDRLDSQNILLATTNHSLVVYNVSTKQLKDFEELKSFSSSARHFFIDDDQIFLATDNGLLLLDRSFKIKRHWTKKEDLANAFIYAVLKDENGYVWVSTNYGISRIDLSNDRVINFNKLDGLQDYEFNTASALQFPENKLAFGGVNGFNIIDTKKFYAEQSISSPNLNEVYINQVKYPVHRVEPNQSIALPYDSNYLNFYFNNTDHWTKKPEYWYSLSGLDTTWISNGHNTHVNYSKLAPGKYVFLLKTAINGSYSEPVEALSIIIHPAFWQTKVFKLCFLILGLLMIYAGYRFFLNKKTKQFKNEKRIRDLEAKMMKYKMNPHFIFNTLNALKHHALFKPKQETAEYVTEFSELIRGILDYSDKETISLAKDIRWTERYIHTENKRLSNQVKYDVKVDPNLNIHSIKVPPFLLQAFIEEVIWQRLVHNKDRLELTIMYKKNELGFEIIIEDNGSNLPTNISETKYNGLALAYERIRHFNKIKNGYSINVDDQISDVHNIDINRKIIRFLNHN